METSLKPGFAQTFSCCPKNLSRPKLGGAAAPLAPPARTPMFQTNIIWWFGVRLVKWLLISRSRILGIPVWLFPQKECESLLANCGENRLQSIGNEKQQQQQQQSKNNNRKQKQKKQERLLLFSPSFPFALACFLSIFFSFYFCVMWFWGFFCSRNLHFGLRGFHLNGWNFH